PGLVNADTLSAMLGTDAAYLDLVAEFLHAPGNLGDFVESRGIAGQQLTHFQRAVKKVQHLATMGEDLIEAINKDQVVRIRLDPDYAPQQMIILTRYLTDSHHMINPCYEGVVVVLEENERLAAMDKTRQIPHAVFAGRKRGIYYVVVGHTPLEQLKAGEWGAALADQFDNKRPLEAQL
ncbi:MAG: hypothetical protein QCI38_09030, partial [Candidatus Thermoplasmatota archaeon]|nr:hypothetical protein [Candidatus Thermoplasmatota archaeon]